MPQLMIAENLLKVEVEFVYTPVINFAMQQNHVPILRKLRIKNVSLQDVQNISIEIAAEPEFAVLWKYYSNTLRKEESIDIGPANINLLTKYLSELTERIEGNFTLTIKGDDEIIYKEIYSISLLAYDQWNGIAILPEMVAAFVTPNHPEIFKIIKRAAATLEKWTESPSFDAYQSQNPDRVKKQMAAIYEAIAEMQIIYCTVPASFEETGQRIRMCDSILAHKMANCLDLSLLYASCLEAVGIHPLLIVTKGHAFVGGWLIDDSFADSINDDPSLLTKRLADGINEVVVVEATCMNAGQQAAFDVALKNANYNLAKDDDFILFLDITRARFSGIRPIPLRIKTLNGWEIVDEVLINRNTDVPEEIALLEKLAEVDQVKVSKQILWERKLLDLTLRNNLLNLRITRNTIQLISVNLNKLEDELATGKEFQVLSKPGDWDNPLRNAGVYHSINSSDPIIDLVKHEFSQNRLRSYLSENELSNSLTNLYRASRLSLEENGANTLYLALGVLKWYETSVSERPRYSPLLLLPVEIIRKSAQKGYVIRSREEETMMNITLLEMLRQDFGITIGGLETLPKDVYGIDVKMIFNILRQGIMSKARWDIEEQAFLGTFSFSKFIMWNDIHNKSDKLSKNKIVASLISGKIEWEAGRDLSDSEDFDKSYHPSTILLPISADSSQFEAISAAVKNNSFVLHGPPGTGKSQTITNIIANALYNGKKVLFVAAKKAALDVVEKRLESIGIGSFCLELHSNKSKKSAVLEQLKRTVEITKKDAPETFKSEADRLNLLREELNGYVEALHKKYAFGFSLYDSFTGYAEFIALPDKIIFNDQTIESLRKDQIIIWNDAVEELQAIGINCSHPHNHPLEGIYINQYNQQIKKDLQQLIENYVVALNLYKVNAANICHLLKLEFSISTREESDAIKSIAELLIALPDIPSTLLNVENIEQILSQVIGIAEHGKKRDIIRNELFKSFNKNILIFDAERTLSEWNSATDKWFLPKLLKQNSISKSLNEISTNGRIEKQKIVPTLKTIINYQNEQEVINNYSAFLIPLLGFMWQGGDCNWNKLISICDSTLTLNRQIVDLIKNIQKVKEWKNALTSELSEGSQSYIAMHGKALQQYITTYNDFKEKEIKLHDVIGVDFMKLKMLLDNWIDNTLQHTEKWLENIESLKDWFNWIQSKAKAIKVGLSPLVTVYENGGIQSNEVINSFKKGLYKSCAEYIIKHDPQLSSFNGKLFEDKIRKFREISNNFEQLTKDELYDKLASKIPSFAQEAAQSSEIGILQRTIKNNGRATSIRKLFGLIPNLLPRICPCMLMSPISVAQYFDTGNIKFDLVVFDEASQMPTCEAVGAIARGNNLIIVGDPKQMPPTSFFSSNNIDEDNIEKEDLESILDDCLALSMPSKYLLWHYRSKHESLIAFSNSKFYGNKLLTFPSPDDITSKVHYINVEGHYDRGKTRQNLFEAKAVVDEIIRRLSDPVLSMQSIGIVTFSSVQQILIDDMLNEIFKIRPDLETIALESAEPLFIKNLENVQGDERDVILFSIGYGPDLEGKVNLNFGPINREGGWRRLNVAVSRARYEMKVFSTLKADQIDVTRTSSEGVAALKSFLEYAEKGKNVLGYRNISQEIKNNSLENLIATEIKKYGYDVNTNIGCSGYKIDIGVVNPAKPTEYILGVLLDGYNYRSAKTAKDREVIQTDALKMLGWKVHKIWAVDWWENPDKIMGEIIEAIKKAEEGVPIIPLKEALDVITKIENKKDTFITNSNSIFLENKIVENKSYKEYEICNLDIVLSTSSDDFLQTHNRRKICDQIFNVVQVEAPISKSLLCKRVLSSWGISRIGTRVNTQFEILFSQLNLRKTGKNKNLFFWSEGQKPEDYSIYRITKDDSKKREADDLPPEEVANAVKSVLKNSISLSKDALIRETARLFGFARSGGNVEMSMINGIETAISKGYAASENDRVVIKE
jgi:Protein of unknown function (DUF4011)/REase_MTES_1575/Protein of unknown function (DUF3320)/AAA domain